MHATLTLADPEAGLTVEVTFDRFDSFDSRPQYHYVVRSFDGDKWAEGTDLRGGCGDAPNLAEAAATLLTFLSAAAESGPDGENGDLFPRELVESIEHCGEEIDEMRRWLRDD